MKSLNLMNNVILKNQYPHIIAVGKQGKFKDLLLVKAIYDHCHDAKSIFEGFLFKESIFCYPRDIRHVYANCWLDDEYFPGYELITDFNQINDLRDGILYWHDLELMFNSRQFTNKNMDDLLMIVNNARKHRLMILGSCHREMSLDVKLRSLINLWVVPEPYVSGDFHSMANYVVVVTVYDSYLNKIGIIPFTDLHMYANLYDTEEESIKLKF